MKKILIATTALVATAGVASAELSFGGLGRVGIGYEEGAVNAEDLTSQEFRIEQRFRLTVTGSAETDAGVKLEGRIRVETNEDADNSLPGSGGFGAAGFAVSSGGFRLDVGHVSDVIDSSDVLVWGGKDIGLTGFVGQNTAFGFGFVGGFGAGSADTTTIKAKYESGGFTVSASYSKDANEETSPAVAAAPGVPAAPAVSQGGDIEEFQLGVGYSFGNYNVGAVFGSNDGPGVASNDFWLIGFDGDLGAFGFSVIIGDEDSATDVAYGLSIDYEVSAATEIRFTYSDGGLADAPGADPAFGIGFRHSLGGGVSLRGGIGQNVAGRTVADLGVNFDF